MNLLLLHLLARDLGPPLRGARLGTPASYPPVFTVPVHTAAGERHLVVITATPGPFCFLSPVTPLERARAPVTMARLGGRRVAGVRAVEGDRIMEIVTATEGDETDPLALRLAIFGGRARVELRRGDTVLESVGRAGARSGGEAPRAAGASILTAGADAVAELAQSGSLAGEGGPQRAVAGLDPALLDAFGGPDALDAAALIAFRDGVVAGQAPFALRASGRPATAVPVPPSGDPAFTRGDDAALAIGHDVLEAARREIVERLLRPVRRRLAAGRSLAANLRRDLERAAGHERIRREAETLAAFRARVPRGAAAATLPDLYDPDRTVDIELDPALSVETQIQARFRRATKLARSAEHAGRRLELVEREGRELEAGLRLVAEAGSFSESLQRLETLRAKYDIDAAPAPARRRARAQPASRFRRYDIDATWFVMVGRDNRENDELTFHEARPEELWFHAQGVPGSHVVLKSRAGGPEAPPARVIEAAASVAAQHSKARHSGLVPVIYTRRKYVRKFRGARPGQVRCEREKMVMVPPGLPGAASEDAG